MGAPVLSPELTRNAIAVARHLSSAARAWSMYPPEHPVVGTAVERLQTSLGEVAGGAPFAFGVTPKTLLVAGVPLPEDQQSVADAAGLLHECDLLEITFLGPAPVEALHALLGLLRTGSDELRARGGPAEIWRADGHLSIALEQIDYAKILEDRNEPPPERHDDIWRSLVASLAQGRHELDALQQQRLLEISANAFQIGELASAAAAPQCTPDGSPLVTTQAATMLATFRHLAGIVTVMEPERMPEVLRNLATASSTLDPHVIVQLMQTDESLQEEPLIGPLATAFDDATVANLLTGALARDGRAHARLAQVFHTIAPDPDRKRRVLRMTRKLLDERDFGKGGQLKAAWATMEELLLRYDETPFVDKSYQATIEGVGARAEQMVERGLPPELGEWKETLGQDNVRTLSVMLMTDLLRMEEQPERAVDIAGDMVALLEDLFAAGDFANAATVLTALSEAASGTRAPAACRAALVAAGETPALEEAAGLLGELDGKSLERFTACCVLIGPSAIRGLYPLLQVEAPSTAFGRARDLVASFGAEAAEPLLPLADDDRWFVQRTAAELLGLTRAVAAVPPLQAMLRRGDTRLVQPAVSALAGIDDPAAARALQTALRAAAGDARAALVDALVAAGEARVAPMLAGFLAESDPFGGDHDTVLTVLDALRQMPNPRAVPGVRAVMFRTRLFRRRRARAFKTACVAILEAIEGHEAREALDAARREGDRLLRKIARARQG